MFLHSHSACMMASISRSCVGYFCSGDENIFEVKATGYQVLCCFCSRRPPEATNEASEKILKGSSKLGSFKTGWDVRSHLSSSNASSHCCDHSKGTLPVKTDMGAMTVE